MTPEEYSASFDARVRTELTEAAAEVPALRRRMRAAGLEPRDLQSARSLDELAVISKDQLVELQENEPPFGGLLAERAPVRRVYQSPGPLYEAELWGSDLAGWSVGLRAAGIRAEDVVLNAFGYHLSPAGMLFDAACATIGAAVLPGGVGNKKAQARACVDLGITAYLGLPSYLKALLEEAPLGVREGLGIRTACLSGEPLPDDLRVWLEARVKVVRQVYGTAEAGLLGYECGAQDGLHVPKDRLVQVCDPLTGRPVEGEEEGEVVATVISRHYGLVRFGTGDLSAFVTAPCICGEPTPRIRGWLGRTGDAVKVRGMFVHPRQLAAVMGELPEVEQYRFTVQRRDHKDFLCCELVVGDGGAAALEQRIQVMVRSALRLDVEVVRVQELDDDGRPLVDLRGANRPVVTPS